MHFAPAQNKGTFEVKEESKGRVLVLAVTGDQTQAV